MANAKSTDLIEQYMKAHKGEESLKFWAAVESYARNKCEGVLWQGVHVHVASRIKSNDSLGKKLVNRQSKYAKIADIKKDIVDVLGLRVLVYFPSSMEEVTQFIDRAFAVDEWLRYPLTESIAGINESILKKAEYNHQFPGYTAKHGRVRLKENDRKNIDGYTDEIFEIQVVSALEHAWSEVQHEILYKWEGVRPNDDVARIIDSLNGLIKTGEVMLNQLEKSFHSSRAQGESFKNKYELGVYISSNVSEDLIKKGSLGALYRLLNAINFNSRIQVENEISRLGLSRPDMLSEVGREIQAKYRDFEASACVLIMDRMLSSLRRLQVTSKYVMKANATIPDKPDVYRCKVVISTLLWPIVLFSPHTKVTEKIREHFMDKEHRKSLKWALESFIPYNIQCGHPAEEVDLKRVEDLWNSFKDSNEPIFELAFKISRLGVWRELPADFTLLESLRSKLLTLQPWFFEGL